MQARDQKPLRVLELESSNNWGGQEERILREMDWLGRHGHQPILACNAKSAIAARARAAGLDVRAVPMRMNFDLPGLLKLRALVRSERPDLIHAHSSKDSWFALWFHLAGVPVVRSRHISLSARMPFGRKLVYRHGCRRLIGSAGFIADNMREVIGVPADRVEVIGECVDTTEFHPGDGGALRQELGIAPDAPLFAIIAMLRGEKGHNTYVRAAREVLRTRPDVRFLVVGDSAKSNATKLTIQEILRTEFSGFPEPPVIMAGFRKDIPQIMRAIDCLVVPSRREAQTMVIPQAFATGKTAIGARAGGIPELIRDGENGLLVPPDDVHALAAAMLKIAEDPELRRRLGEAGYKLAQSELATDIKMGLLVACYRRTVGSTSRGRD